MKIQLVEGIDYYLNKQGFKVLTKEYHLKRGKFCWNACLNCPYNHINVPEKMKINKYAV